MTINTKIVVAFDHVQEYEQIVKFADEHPDWMQSYDSRNTFFVKKYSIVNGFVLEGDPQ